MGKNQLLQGNEVCALAAINSGVKFSAGYPITPSSEIIEVLSAKLPDAGGKFIQMEDELASMGAIVGASVMGVKSITVTSGPGFDLMQENLAFAAMAEIPCVVVDVQRSGPSTGGATNPSQGDLMQVKYGRSADTSVIALYPNSVKEIYQMTIEAFNMSETYMTPVVLLMDEIIGHLRESICMDDYSDIKLVTRKLPVCDSKDYHPYATDETGIVKLMPFGNKEGFHYVINGMHHTEDGMPNISPVNTRKTISRINDKIDRYERDIWRWEEKNVKDAEILIVACGAASRSAAEAADIARKKGKGVGVFRPISIWPFPIEPFRIAAKGVKKIIVPEMNRGQLVHIIKENTLETIEVVLIQHYDGTAIMPEHILKALEEN